MTYSGNDGGAMIVSIYAMDWGTYYDQVSKDIDFKLVKGWVHGQIIKETEDFLAVAQQVFDEGDVRVVVTIPKACILERIDH